MGIANLWKFIAESEQKFSLEQLVTFSNKKGKVLRVAIDVALWIFQARSSVAGDSSELRALFFRFCRLYELGIRPVFVFDGKNRPSYKRNKEINTAHHENRYYQTIKELIRLFNFSVWDAYGEAEAECALLERLGYVDVVFTGDSDIFLFGARHVVRQWPSKRHELIPCYDSTWIKETTGLDRSDLILIALLRGSDYDVEGTRGIGVQVAAQLSKCRYHVPIMDDVQRFGRENLIDGERLQHLFDDLTYELHHNTTKNLMRRRPNAKLDAKFFDIAIVVDFIHPITNIGSLNNAEVLQKAKELDKNLQYYNEPDWLRLIPFIQMTFKWSAEYLLKRVSSLLYPAYVLNKLRRYQHTFKKGKTTEVDLITKITGSKLSEDKLKLYRVEWDISTFISFQELVKLKIDWNIFRENNDELEEEEFKNEDLFSTVKRQWVDSDYIHNVYPLLALEYKNDNQKKRINKEPKNSTDFLILPPRINK